VTAPADRSTTATIAAYDAIAATYDQRQDRLPNFLGSWLERFAATVRPDGLVADLGCGPARHGQTLAGLGLQVVGVDLSAGMVAIARQRLPGRIAQGDLRHLPIATAALDGVWSAAALLHVPRTDVPAVLAEFRRVLRPGGALGLVTAAGEQEGWEPVPYVQGWQRWYVYHPPALLADLLTAPGWTSPGPMRRNTVVTGSRCLPTPTVDNGEAPKAEGAASRRSFGLVASQGLRHHVGSVTVS
jgi:SAM-dependent methyltransferase